MTKSVESAMTNPDLAYEPSTVNQMQQTEYKPIKSQIKRLSSNALHLALGVAAGDHQTSPVRQQAAPIHIPVRQASPAPSQPGSPNSPLSPVGKAKLQEVVTFRGLNLSRIIPTTERASPRSAKPLWLINKKPYSKAVNRKVNDDSKSTSRDLELGQGQVKGLVQAGGGSDASSTE